LTIVGVDVEITDLSANSFGNNDGSKDKAGAPDTDKPFLSMNGVRHQEVKPLFAPKKKLLLM